MGHGSRVTGHGSVDWRVTWVVGHKMWPIVSLSDYRAVKNITYSSLHYATQPTNEPTTHVRCPCLVLPRHARASRLLLRATTPLGVCSPTCISRALLSELQDARLFFLSLLASAGVYHACRGVRGSNDTDHTTNNVIKRSRRKCPQFRFAKQ